MTKEARIIQLERRIAWATKYGSKAIERGDRKTAAVYSKIEQGARKQIEGDR